MTLRESNNLYNTPRDLNSIRGGFVAKLVMHVLRLSKLNEICSKINSDDPAIFLDSLLETLGITLEVCEEDLRKIPTQGAFITVSNHPFMGLDSIILIKLLTKIRPDYKVWTNFLLKQIIPIEDYILGIDPMERRRALEQKVSLKEATRHILSGKPLGVFPAEEVSSYQLESNHIEDPAWNISTLTLIKRANVPIVPIYMKGSNSLLFYLLGLIHPMLRNMKLPSELLNKKKS